MPVPNASFFRELVRLLRTNLGEQPLPTDLTREFDDLQKFSLSLLVTFFTIHAIPASNVLGAATLALFVYTINLHITINANFLRNSPALSRFLHAVPLLGIFCMAIFKLVIIVQSPAIIATVLLTCAIPPLIFVICLAKQCVEMMLVSDAAEMVVVWG